MSLLVLMSQGNKTEIQIIKYIFQRIKEHKLSKLFWDNDIDISNPDIVHPLNFNFIEQKLLKGLYKDRKLFTINMRLCLENAKNGNQNDILRYAAACELSRDFEALVNSLDSPTFAFTVPITTVTNQFLLKNEHPGKFVIPTEKDHDAKPGALIFEEEIDENDHEKLLRDIRFCTTAGLSMRIVSYMRSLQPETVIVGKELLLKTRNLTPENLLKLRKFVTKTMHDAATGKIDAFTRPYGRVVTPVVISNNDILPANEAPSK